MSVPKRGGTAPNRKTGLALSRSTATSVSWDDESAIVNFSLVNCAASEGHLDGLR